MVEYVENLGTELQPQSLAYSRVLENPHVPIIDRGVAAQRTRSVAEGSERHVVVEEVRIENKAVGSWIVRLERRNQVRLARALKPQRTALQFAVVAVVHQDGEAALIGVDARDFP